MCTLCITLNFECFTSENAKPSTDNKNVTADDKAFNQGIDAHKIVVSGTVVEL